MIEELGERVWQLHSQGLSPREIRDRLLGRELPIAYWTLGHFSGLNLVRSYLRRIVWLGRLETFGCWQELPPDS